MIQSFAEEFVFRGFLYQHLSKMKGLSYGIIVTNIIFALLHSFNKGNNIFSFVNIFLIGTAFNIIMLITKNIVTSSAIHAGWNFLNQIVFGLPNSGLVAKDTIIPSVLDNNSLWVSSMNGAEGGFAATIVLLIFLSSVFALYRVKVIKK
ncbi:CPBP family intramembrane glutamic endopeptidase [Anaeromicropila herbilytica]|uniref:CAAX prenyl protease 2/Lysostaphin resistance protein A-like domain-containing protein n=1 Tax=Anaeromicropila herbilytica TaxID=2785025 RepID=A0A7R7IB78_9FIRM|nr:CPBP family intramembrane glutamic endopeptidase [Anaeromicropila herbilytica]BCN29242.1 hypothetical protein bsdtb5_05370 [Anaeromicropila herbilytica]